MFKALVLDQVDDALVATVKSLSPKELPEGEVEVSVLYSSVNYKDALAVTGKGKIIRGSFPFVPGIDMVGRVEASASPRFGVGDLVVQTGGGQGESYWGGYTQRQRLGDQWLIPLPASLTPLQAMTLGTAGVTAMYSVMALEHQGITPDRGEVIVTGASGGVGSIAVALLAQLGYTVVASTGKAEAAAYLQTLGAASILPREALSEGPERPLASAEWVGAIDTVGGKTLASVLSRLAWHGCAAICGNAGGHELHTTVFPFILRGVSMLGIDSNTMQMSRREEAWRRLPDILPSSVYDLIRNRCIALEQLPDACQEVIAGKILGRIVVDPNL